MKNNNSDNNNKKTKTHLESQASLKKDEKSQKIQDRETEKALALAAKKNKKLKALSLKTERKAILARVRAEKKLETAKKREKRRQLKLELKGNEQSLLKWYKLDNAGKIYPAVSSTKDSNVFRVGARLNENVDPSNLKDSLGKTLERFPAFKVKMKRGMFWYFYEYNEKECKVFLEDDCPCAYLETKLLNDYLFKVSYFENRIYLDVFHSLSDGTGAMEFLKTLLFCYFQNKGDEVETEGLVLSPKGKSSLHEWENSYVKFFSSKAKTKRKGSVSFKMKGQPLPYGFKVIYAWLDTKALLEKARSYGATVTEFVSAITLKSIFNLNFKDNEANFKKPITLLVPVNLRRSFSSVTTRNFSSVAYLKLKCGDSTEFPDLLQNVKEQLKAETTKENLLARFSSHTVVEKILIIRILPRPLKDFVMKIGYKFSIRSLTSNLSNVGLVKLPKSFEGKVERLEFQSSCSPHGVTFGSMISYGGKTQLAFTRRIEECDLEREVIQSLAKEGLEIVVEENEANS